MCLVGGNRYERMGLTMISHVWYTWIGLRIPINKTFSIRGRIGWYEKSIPYCPTSGPHSFIIIMFCFFHNYKNHHGYLTTSSSINKKSLHLRLTVQCYHLRILHWSTFVRRQGLLVVIAPSSLPICYRLVSNLLGFFFLLQQWWKTYKVRVLLDVILNLCLFFFLIKCIHEQWTTIDIRGSV